MKIDPTETQCARIKEHLDAGHEIDPITALRKFKCFRLASRICELQQDHGMTIDKRMEQHPRTGKRYAVYSKARKARKQRKAA